MVIRSSWQNFFPNDWVAGPRPNINHPFVPKSWIAGSPTRCNYLFVPNGSVAGFPIQPKLKLVIFTVEIHGKMYYTLEIKNITLLFMLALFILHILLFNGFHIMGDP